KFLERKPAHNFVAEQPRVDGVWIFAGPDDEFVEPWHRGKQNRRVFAELLRGIGGLSQILARKLLQPDFAVDGHANVCHHCDACLIGADVRGRLFATNVLLAGGKREYKTALAVSVGGLTNETSRHLPHVGFTCGDNAAIWTAESERHTERLCFHGDDVCGTRRLDDPERNS